MSFLISGQVQSPKTKPNTVGTVRPCVNLPPIFNRVQVIEMIRSRQLLPCPEDCPSRMYAFMVEYWHELPNRPPTFQEIYARLRQWEGMSCGYQSTHSNSHSMCGQSDQSTSQHSSTGIATIDPDSRSSIFLSSGPSNNTGSTSLSNQREGYGGANGYARPFQVSKHL